MRMIRHALIGTTSLAMAAAMSSVATADTIDGPQVHWDYSAWGSERAFTAGIERIAEFIEERTGGNFTMEIHYGEALSSSTENLDSIQIGAFEAAMMCASYHPGKNPVMNGLDLPFLPIPDIDTKIAVTEAYFEHPAQVEEMERWNAMVLMDNLLPKYEPIGRGDPPESIEDWEGIRIRAVGGLADAFRELGAVPTSLPAPELYTSMDRGVIDAAAVSYTYMYRAYQLDEIADWYTTNMNPGSIVCPTIISLDAWNALPPEYQDLIYEARGEAYEALREAYVGADEELIPQLEERGVVAISYDDDEVEAIRERAAEPIWEEWMAEASADGIPAEELLELILETARAAQQ